jgi:hypothetical protein
MLVVLKYTHCSILYRVRGIKRNLCYDLATKKVDYLKMKQLMKNKAERYKSEYQKPDYMKQLQILKL